MWNNAIFENNFQAIDGTKQEFFSSCDFTSGLEPASLQKNSTVGRCDNCALDINTGEYGYYFSVTNCRCPTGNENCMCDITINNFNKRHECKDSLSVFNCLYDNPTAVYFEGQDITNNLNRVQYEGEQSIHPGGFIKDSRAIDGGTAIMLLQRFSRPCGEGVGDYYMGPNEPGCLPYGDSIMTNTKSTTKCNNGNEFGLTSCCTENGIIDYSCESTKTEDCNPCTAVVEDLPVDDPVWKDDICYFYCPSYWTQRQYLQRDGFYDSDDQVCSDKYKTLCDLMGCDVDPPCQIRWGGATLCDIDMDLCNGGEWDSRFLLNYTPIDRCNLNPPSDYCATNPFGCFGNNDTMCKNQGPDYVTRCTNDPKYTPGILPIVYKDITHAPTMAPTSAPIPAPVRAPIGGNRSQSYTASMEECAKDLVDNDSCKNKGGVDVNASHPVISQGSLICTYAGNAGSPNCDGSGFRFGKSSSGEELSFQMYEMDIPTTQLVTRCEIIIKTGDGSGEGLYMDMYINDQKMHTFTHIEPHKTYQRVIDPDQFFTYFNRNSTENMLRVKVHVTGSLDFMRIVNAGITLTFI